VSLSCARSEARHAASNTDTNLLEWMKCSKRLQSYQPCLTGRLMFRTPRTLHSVPGLGSLRMRTMSRILLRGLDLLSPWTLGHEVSLGFQQLLSMILPFNESKNDNANDIPEVNGQIAELHRSFPWASLKNGKVVDIGGGSGHISIGLARVFPLLYCFCPQLTKTYNFAGIPRLALHRTRCLDKDAIPSTRRHCRQPRRSRDIPATQFL
jgi:hypothetical protein